MSKRFIFLLVSLFFLTATHIFAKKHTAQTFHPHDIACNSCHLASTKVTKDNAHQLLATQEKLCSSCHEKALKVSHPSGLVPSMKFSDTFPLDWKQEMTCSTCHNVHAVEYYSIRGNLRGKSLCLSCHQISFFSAMTDSGISIQQSVHKKPVSNNFSAVDSYSLECLNCHANKGDTKSIAVSSRGIVKHSSGAVNHPVGMLYRDAYNKGSYRHIDKISKNIIFPDGKVSCISCHKGYSRKHGEMVSAKSTTALCFECHDI